MMAQPMPLFPHRESILKALEHLFGGYLDGLHDGLIEIASCEGQGGEHPIWRASLFGTDELEEAADWAVAENERGRNVYFAPALRKPETRRDKRATKADVLGTVVLWGEWDVAAAFEEAKQRMNFCKPTLGCITGRTPATRAQAMWRLDAAITDINEIERAVAGIAVALSGDTDVCNADRLMRLPGSISWRKLNKPERIDEPTKLMTGYADRPAAYSPAQVAKAYQPAAPVKNLIPQGEILPDYAYARGPLGLSGDIVDGREKYLRDTVWAVFIDLGGSTGSCPTAQELYDVVWPQYSAHVDLTRPGRGMNECMFKCRRIVQRFERGELAELPDLPALVAEYQKKPRQLAVRPESPAALVDKQAPTTPDGLYRLLSIGDMRALPPAEWLVDQYLPEGGFATLYAPPKSLKSFLALDMLLHIATGRPWRGKAVKQGAVLYIAGEGHRGAAKRIAAWLQHHGVGDDVSFFMTTHAIPMTEPGSIEKLIATVRAKAEEIGMPIAAVCVDTVARSFGGGDENATKDMNAFVAGCDAVRHALSCTVLGVHHTGKDKERGMRGSTALLGAVDTVLKVERNESRLTLSVEEQRDGEEQEDIYFETQKVELAGHIKPVSSLVLVPADEGGAHLDRGPKLTRQQRMALDVLIDCTAREGFVPGANDHIPAHTQGVEMKTWRNYFRAKVADAGLDAESVQKAFKRAADILIAEGVVGKWQEFSWVIKKTDKRT